MYNMVYAWYYILQPEVSHMPAESNQSFPFPSKWCYEVKWNSEKPRVNSIFKRRIFNCPSKLLYQGTFHGLADNRCMSPSQMFSAQPQLDWTKDYSCIDPRPYPSSDLGKINDWAVTPCIHSGRFHQCFGYWSPTNCTLSNNIARTKMLWGANVVRTVNGMKTSKYTGAAKITNRKLVKIM